jgi:sulfatase maturation enzyme AslB (radical SAM superfamily)
MNSDIISTKELEKKAGKRVSLGELVPLQTPFSIQFTPASFCNFKCIYCWQSLDNNTLSKKIQKTIHGL